MLFLLEENHQWQVQPPLDADHGAEMPSRSNIQLKEKQPITSISSVITYRLCPCDIKLMLYDEVTKGRSWGTQDARGWIVLKSCYCQERFGAVISHPRALHHRGEGMQQYAAIQKSCRDTFMAASRAGEGYHLETGRSWQPCCRVAAQGWQVLLRWGPPCSSASISFVPYRC